MSSTTTHRLICGDVLEVLPQLPDFQCCFLDPPDAIGLSGNGYCERPKQGYMKWLSQVLREVIPRCGTTWLSYNAIWDVQVKHWVYGYVCDRPSLEVRPFVWTYTFGQNRESDCGPGHRPLLRFRWPDSPLYPDQIKVASWRQLHGDKRAAPGGRVPLDHWDFPRVTGNSKQRRPWHPTQHPEALLERAIKLSTREGDSVLDLFSGTGTTIRVCKRIGRNTTSVELNPVYCAEIAREHNLDIAGVWASEEIKA